VTPTNEKAPALGRVQGLGDGAGVEYLRCRRGVPCRGHHAKRGRRHGVAPARRLYPAWGLSVLPLPTVRGRSSHPLEIGT
jgi:hypothetical protein